MVTVNLLVLVDVQTWLHSEYSLTCLPYETPGDRLFNFKLFLTSIFYCFIFIYWHFGWWYLLFYFILCFYYPYTFILFIDVFLVYYFQYALIVLNLFHSTSFLLVELIFHCHLFDVMSFEFILKSLLLYIFGYVLISFVLSYIQLLSIWTAMTSANSDL